MTMQGPAAAGHSVAASPDQLPLVVTAISHKFGALAALDNVSLQVAAGEVVSLLGPNGAGKTTLIRTIAGRLAPDHGTVRVLGDNPARSRKARGRIGLVPQNLALYDTLTARENLEIFGGLFGLSPAAARIRAGTLLAQTGLGEKASEPVQRLSGGMRRRLNIAAAVMHEPAVLLLDEPSVGVDIQALDGVIALIRQLRGAGYAIVLTTHDMALAEAVSDRIVLLKAGRVIIDGSLPALKERAFGTGQLVIAAFAAPVAGTPARAALASLGLQARDDNTVWRGSTGATPGLVNRLLAVEGVPPLRQLTVADPDLAETYVALTDEPVPHSRAESGEADL